MRRRLGCWTALILAVLLTGQLVGVGIALAAGTPPDLRGLAALLGLLLLMLLVVVGRAVWRRRRVLDDPSPATVRTE